MDNGREGKMAERRPSREGGGGGGIQVRDEQLRRTVAGGLESQYKAHSVLRGKLTACPLTVPPQCLPVLPALLPVCGSP